jgi:hypothetical protein
MITKDKFIVSLPSMWSTPWPQYFDNFWAQCTKTAHENGWSPSTVANYQLRPLGGKLVRTKTQGWYLRWDDEQSHTFFVLKWS